jgi:hypothetical protein
MSDVGSQKGKSKRQRADVGGHPGEMRSAVVNEFHRAGRAEDRDQRTEDGGQTN